MCTDREQQELEERIRGLETENAQLKKRLAELQQRLDRLSQEVRQGKRQAAPFAKEKPTATPKRPGRHHGRGRYNYRQPPSPEQVDQTHFTPLPACPECGSLLQDRKTEERFQIDLPPVQPIVTRFVNECGYCPQCRQRFEAQHADQLSRARGAACVSLGPRVLGLGSDLHHRLGLSYGKVTDLLQTVFALPVTPGGLCQADQRLAKWATPVYEELVAALREACVVHADETGWRIGTLSAWLWVFTNRAWTVYKIESSRGHEVVVDVLGRRFAGVLECDCFKAYEARALTEWLQQKCVGHLIKELRRLEEEKRGRAVCFVRDVLAVLRAALVLRDEKGTLPPERFAHQAAQLETRLDVLIASQRQFTDADNVRFAKRLRRHREHLLRFLYVDEVEATNNRAERMLRPAVISRKTGGCNKTATGARTHAILASLSATCRQQERNVMQFFTDLARSRVSGKLPSLVDTRVHSPP